MALHNFVLEFENQFVSLAERQMAQGTPIIMPTFISLDHVVLWVAMVTL